jgi:hypothetical protein
MSFIYDSSPVLSIMRRKTLATREAIKAAAPKREPMVRRTVDYTIQAMGGSVKRGGAFGHRDR